MCDNQNKMYMAFKTNVKLKSKNIYMTISSLFWIVYDLTKKSSFSFLRNIHLVPPMNQKGSSSSAATNS